MNVVVALVALLLIAPLMLAIAILIRATSSGPVIYRQPRVGLDRRQKDAMAGGGRRSVDAGGRVFTMYKFRTMRAENGGPQVWAVPEDPRITRVGRVLRAYRLDELPQLFNVLKGDMNIVGPRPEQPEIFARLRTQIHGYQERQRVLPGITGTAQLKHHYDRSIEDVKIKLAFDLQYIAGESALEDFRIMLQTFPVMLGRQGAL